MLNADLLVYSSDLAQCRSPSNQFLSSMNLLQVLTDLQSYLSDLTLFLAPESKTFYILVDNRPWLEDLVSGPAHLWQLMVTKVAESLSPFAITGGQKGNKEDPKFSEFNCRSKPSKNSQKLKRWLSMVTLSRKRVLLPVEKLRTSLLANSKLHRTLYGFIVFEVAWKDVRGINYLNQLQQIDTSLAIESKYMRRWEFDSIAQAAKGITSWFQGTPYERLLFEHHLNSMIGEAFHEAGMETPSTCSPTASCQLPSPCPSECVEATEASQYRDVLLLFRFNDLLIGFYDLYKNIPVLKATASRLFGPLFDWIETWEMVSRIKYLGTMLFLHNAEKAIMWLLMLVAATGVMSPIFLCLWRALSAITSIVLGLSKYLGLIYKYIYESLEGIWMFVSSILKVASNAELATKHTYEVSMWRALWNDLFSKLAIDTD
ncbi:hypothetical protein E3N88_45284 [Mikania micrantha]|uniref:Uncharacterized protein n=1 Tax=Mikania micrantha TaxID=192012 RepID=A0A5N6LA98_9ASTR|nr:hypothetical protein E3N88_45284 [Mikania micrantha]